MIISRTYALSLVRKGKAAIEGGATRNDGFYVIVSRYDLQRTDHYVATDADRHLFEEE